MDETLRTWVEETAGGPITDVSRPASGGSRELYFVDVAAPDGAVVRLVLRCEGGGSFSGTEISPAKEAVVYRALEHTAGAGAAGGGARAGRRCAVARARARESAISPRSASPSASRR